MPDTRAEAGSPEVGAAALPSAPKRRPERTSLVLIGAAQRLAIFSGLALALWAGVLWALA